jgi:hypothetical protein
VSAELLEVYGWVSADPLMDAYCIAVVPTADANAVVDAYGCARESRRDVLFAEQSGMAVPYPDGWGNDTVQIDRIEHVVVALENNGWAGTEEPRPQRLSAGGTYAAVYRNVNAVSQVVVARGGELVRQFEPGIGDRDGRLPEELGLPWDDPTLWSASTFALLEKLTAVQLTRSWLLEQPHPAYTRA